MASNEDYFQWYTFYSDWLILIDHLLYNIFYIFEFFMAQPYVQLHYLIYLIRYHMN